MKKMLISFGAAVVCGIVGADNMVKNGGAEDNIDWFTGFSGKLTNLVKTGKSCYYVDGQKIIYGKQFIPVDTSKKYELSGWFKSCADPSSKIYFGLAAYDAKKQFISSESVYPILKTDTVLAADAAKGAKQIKIKDGANWQTGKIYCVAFNTQADFSDLPNMDRSGNNVIAVKKDGDATVVTLGTPLSKAYKAGTHVREHRASGTYIYVAASNKIVPEIWTKFSGKVGGEHKSGNTPSNMFRRATKFVKILILANYGTPKGRLAVDDIELKEIKK